MKSRVKIAVLAVGLILPAVTYPIATLESEVELHDSVSVTNSSLDELGFLDVTAYGADPTGTTDSTAAIQTAVNVAYSNNMVVFFPEGNYLVSDTINCWQPLYTNQSGVVFSQLRHAHVLVGSTKGKGATIRLADSAPGFGSENSKKNLFQFWCAHEDFPFIMDPSSFQSGRHYNAEMRNLTIDLGAGNSGAIAIWMIGAQGCNIQDVAIDINSGFAGIAGLVGAGSGHAKLTLRNGKYGVWCKSGYMDLSQTSQPMPYLAGCRFINQSESAIYLENIHGTLTLAGFLIDMQSSTNKAAVVLNNSWGSKNDSINLLDGTVAMSGTNSTVILNNGKKSINIENTYFRAGMLVNCADTNGNESGSETSWKRVKRFSYTGQDERADNRSNPSIAVSNSCVVTEEKYSDIVDSTPSGQTYEELASLHLWKCNFAVFEDKDIVIATNHIDRTGATNVTAELQALLDAHDKVFLPKGVYLIDGLSLGADNQLIGIAKNLSILKADPLRSDPPTQRNYMISATNNANSITTVAHLEFQQNTNLTNVGSVHWRAGKRSIVRNVQQWYTQQTGGIPRNQPDFLYSVNGGGKLYNFHHTYALTPGPLDTPCALMFEGTRNLCYVYGLSSEKARVDGQLYFSDARNVSILSYKDENTWDSDYSNPSTERHVRTVIDGSTNISLYGMMHLFSSVQPDVCSTEIINSGNISIFNISPQISEYAATNLAACPMLFQDANGSGTTEFSLDASNPVTRYELGLHQRNSNDLRVWNIMTDDFSELKEHWAWRSNGFSLAVNKGFLESGKLACLGCHNYDTIRVSFDFEDLGGPDATANHHSLRTRLRGQYHNFGDCYEVRLQRDGILRIMAKRRSDNAQITVAQTNTGLTPIDGATHNMDILIKSDIYGNTRIQAVLNNSSEVTWTHSASDTTYHHYSRGTVGFFAGSDNLIDNFTIRDGTLYETAGTTGSSFLFSIIGL